MILKDGEWWHALQSWNRIKLSRPKKEYIKDACTLLRDPRQRNHIQAVANPIKGVKMFKEHPDNQT